MNARSKLMLVIMWWLATIATIIYLIISTVVQWSASDTYAEETTGDNLNVVLGHSGRSLAAFLLLVVLMTIGYIWNPRESEDDPADVEDEEPMGQIIQLRDPERRGGWEPDLDSGHFPQDVVDLIEDMRQAQQ